MSEEPQYDLTTPLEVGDWCYVIDDPYKGAIVKIERLPEKKDAFQRYSVSRNGFSGLTLRRKSMHLLSRDRKIESKQDKEG